MQASAEASEYGEGDYLQGSDNEVMAKQTESLWMGHGEIVRLCTLQEQPWQEDPKNISSIGG